MRIFLASTRGVLLDGGAGDAPRARGGGGAAPEARGSGRAQEARLSTQLLRVVRRDYLQHSREHGLAVVVVYAFSSVAVDQSEMLDLEESVQPAVFLPVGAWVLH